jgi:hypothetical protein
MTLPTSEPIPMPEEQLPPARRRRARRLVLPEAGNEKAAFLDEIGERTTPGIDFFISALLAGLILALAYLFDSPALVILALLLAPFMGPSIGISIASIAGSSSFFFRSLGSLLVGSLIFFLTGTLGGFAARILPPASSTQILAQFHLAWPSLLLLTVGVVMTEVLMIRSSQTRPLISSVAIAYAIYVPVSAAGFGFTSGASIPWAFGLLVFIAHVVWALLVGTLTLIILGLRPFNPVGYILTSIYMLLSAGVLALSLGGGALNLPVMPPIPSLSGMVFPASALRTTPSPASVSNGLHPTTTSSMTPYAGSTPALTLDAALPARPGTPTHTLVPTRTPTITVTAQATPVWARINAKGSNGALVRSDPQYDSAVIQSLLNGIVIQVLPDVSASDGVTWVKIRTIEGKEGWIVRALLSTATPAPGW